MSESFPTKDSLSAFLFSGYWAPSRLDTSPFLQVDLNQWVVVTEVAVQGSPEAGGWVTEYTMSYKQNSAPWGFVPYTTNHSVKVGNP